MSTKSNGSNKNHHKLRLRDSLLNMLSEFVALNKSPEVRLSNTSQQFLLEAVLEEKRDFKQPRHVRSVSSNAALLRTPGHGANAQQHAAMSGIHHSRRISLPAGPSPLQSTASPRNDRRFSFLFPTRMRKVSQADEYGRSGLDIQRGRYHQKQHKQTPEPISESDEEGITEEMSGTDKTVKCIRM